MAIPLTGVEITLFAFAIPLSGVESHSFIIVI